MVVGIFFGWGYEILALSYLRLMLLSKIDVPQHLGRYLFPSLTARARDQIHPATLEKSWRSALR